MLRQISSPARKMLGNFRPFVSEMLMQLIQQPVFLLGPGRLLYLRVQLVVPPADMVKNLHIKNGPLKTRSNTEKYKR